MLAKFNQLKRNKRFDNFIMLYGSKDHYFILLPGHILYRKPGGHKIACTGVKFKSCFNVAENYAKRFLLLWRFRKSIVWPIFNVPFHSLILKKRSKVKFLALQGSNRQKCSNFAGSGLKMFTKKIQLKIRIVWHMWDASLLWLHSKDGQPMDTFLTA